jgi:metal-responsive CopG/Arc/MetJ family transcriptional regulator
MSSLKYLDEHDCSNVKLLKYAEALDNTNLLSVFIVKGDFARRVEFLDKMLKNGMVKTTSSKLAPWNM